MATHLPTPADRALLVALARWGGHESGRFWEHFAPPWRERLVAAWKPRSLGPATMKAATRALARELEEEARPDPRRVHPTWWVRALAYESPAVRRAVAAHMPTSIRATIQRGFRLEDSDLEPDFPPHPEALRWALSLWAERIVGGAPALEDDPPAIVALTRLDQRTLLHMLAATGVAKRAYDTMAPGMDESSGRRVKARDRRRYEHFVQVWGESDPKLARVARFDSSLFQAHSWLGLVTFARLLTTVEPRRVRWALQHIPYSAAKFVRSRMGLSHPHVDPRTLFNWESRVFSLAWDRLQAEGRLQSCFGEPS